MIHHFQAQAVPADAESAWPRVRPSSDDRAPPLEVDEATDEATDDEEEEKGASLVSERGPAMGTARCSEAKAGEKEKLASGQAAPAASSANF